MPAAMTRATATISFHFDAESSHNERTIPALATQGPNRMRKQGRSGFMFLRSRISEAQTSRYTRMRMMEAMARAVKNDHKSETARIAIVIAASDYVGVRNLG